MTLFEKWETFQVKRKQEIEAQHNAIVDQYGENPKFVEELRPYMDFCGGWPDVGTSGQGALEEAWALWKDAMFLIDCTRDVFVVSHAGFDRDWEAAKSNMSLTLDQVTVAENCFNVVRQCQQHRSMVVGVVLNLLPVLYTVREILYNRQTTFESLMKKVGTDNTEAAAWLRERSLEELKMLVKE